MESVSCRFHGLAWFHSWASPHPAQAIAIADQGGFTWISSRPSDALIGDLLRTQIEHGLDLVFKTELEIGINPSCPCQKPQTSRRLTCMAGAATGLVLPSG